MRPFGVKLLCSLSVLALVSTQSAAFRSSTARKTGRRFEKCLGSGVEPVSRATGFIGGLCNQFAPNTCVNSTSSTPEHFKTVVRSVRNSFELSPACGQSLHQIACYSMDPWVGTGKVSGACGSVCLAVLQACMEDYFAEDTMTSSAMALRPCSRNDLVCTRLGTLLQHRTGGTPPATSVASVDASGAVNTGGIPEGALTAPQVQAMASSFCASLGTPLSSAVSDASTWHMPVSPKAKLSAKCYSGSSRSGTGVQERPQGRADEPVLWYVKLVLDSAYAALVSALFRAGLVGSNTMQRAQRGYFTQRGVYAGLGTVTLLVGVVGALGFALCILYMMSNIGAEEAAAMKMARARVQAAEAAENRSLQQPINSIPAVLQAVEQRTGGGGWSTADIQRMAALRAQGCADSDEDKDM